MTQGLARKLSRTKPHRVALLKNMVSQLLQHGTLVSTHEKCKEASRLAERVITMAKQYNSDESNEFAKKKLLANIQSRLFLSGDNRHLMNRLITEIAPNYDNRNGGYTRVLHMEKRFNDRASQSVLELVQTPVVDSKTNEINKGNLKFWLLVKNIINDESNSVPYNQLTLLNLKKIQKFKNDDEFLKDILVIKKCIMDEQGDSWDEISQLTKIKSLVENVKDVKAPETIGKEGSEVKGGYIFVDERPARPII